MERLICAFLWDAGGEKRRHWVKADTILQPYGNGGLNVRKLSEVMTSLHACLAWKIINRTSARASFMASKYEENRNSRRSSLWNRLWPIISRIKEDSFVDIRKGECSFWGSPWCYPVLPKPARCRFKGSVAQFLSSDVLKAQLLPTLPDYARQALAQIQITDAPDNWVWTKHSSGEITVKNYYQFSTPRPPECKVWKKIWFRAIPRKFSFLLWKLRHKIYMVDSFFQHKGYQLASMCNCCKISQSESQDHLFVQGEVAQKIWRWIGDLTNIPYGARNLISLWRDWFSNSNPKSQVGATNLILFSAGIWEIWKFRCAVRYGDCVPSLNELSLKSSWCALVRARLAPLLPNLKAPALPQSSSAVAWKANPEEVTANLASRDHLIAFVCRTRQGRLIGGGVIGFNQATPVPGMQEAIACSRMLCSVSQASSFSLQWDRDVSTSAARKWAAHVSGAHGYLVRRSSNEVARALAREAAAGNIDPSPMLCLQTLPQAILCLISRESEAALAPGDIPAVAVCPQGQS